MRPDQGIIYSHMAGTCGDLQKTRVEKVCSTPGFQVDSFRALVGLVAELGAGNGRLKLLFRGQDRDYRLAGKSALIPSGLRDSAPAGRLAGLAARLETLACLNRVSWQRALQGHPEFWLALIQHYQVAATPFLDLTLSLRAAASYALAGPLGFGPEGTLFVLGLPSAAESFTDFEGEEVKLVRLSSLSPQYLIRRHAHEGSLIGKWPLPARNGGALDGAAWLLAKYRLGNARGSFFDSGFPPAPLDSLFPAQDAFRRQLEALVFPGR